MSASQAIQKREPQQVTQNPINLLFEQFGEDQYNVLAPVTHMAGQPPGTRLSVSEVRVNPDPKAREVFSIAGGQMLIGKPKLDQIAAAAGISWFEERQVDGGSHPHLVQMMVRGRITDFDGVTREITGTKMIDLRESVDGVPGKDYEEIVDKARAGNRDPSRQIREARKFIAEIAASKAKNRAIASALGIKRSYTKEELRRPFVVPKLVLDPSSAHARDLILANVGGATAALYGAKAQANVVDADFEESAPTALPGPKGGMEGGVPAPPSELRHDSNGEVLGDEEVIRIVKESWVKAKAAGMSGADFKGLCQAQTSKGRKEDMTASEARKVLKAVEAFVANIDDDDDTPV
jgi:hypothetical protein